MPEGVMTNVKKTEAKKDNSVPQPRKTHPPHSRINSPTDQILYLQRTIGNRGVERLIKSGTLQAKLKIGQPNDIYEQEADRVAEEVMKIPATQCPVCEEESRVQQKPIVSTIHPIVQHQVKGEETEEEEIAQPTLDITAEFPIQRKKSSTYGPTAAPTDLASPLSDMAGRGQPLPPSARGYFESRFRHDFHHVRIHTHEDADELARNLNAKAFTFGHNIFFRRDQYEPENTSGKRLLAHELTHVIQQSHPELAPSIQRSCEGPQGQFELGKSKVGKKIIAKLSEVTEAIPSPQPGGQPTEQARINPEIVLTLLAKSPCFLHDAQQVEGLYFGKPLPQGGRSQPRRRPPLKFEFHELPEKGTLFLRRESIIRVHATTMAEVVQRIVHEIVHVSHSAPGTRGKKGGRVTRIERGAVWEESQTRKRENEIMKQIVASSEWRQHIGQIEFTEVKVKTAKKKIRGDLWSGLPRLTYQELFIVEGMKKRIVKKMKKRPPGINESRKVVHTLSEPRGSVSRENVNKFRVS